jgi:hypothetical protein
MTLFADGICRVRTLTGKEIELDIEPDFKVQLLPTRIDTAVAHTVGAETTSY